MKTLHLLTAALCLLISTAALAQQDAAATQKAWAAYMTPGPMHEKMAATNGDWSSTMTFWESPGAAPQTSTGNCSYKMILGGRYQESRFLGDFMGMPFEGIGTMAYDNARKLFISTWMDNMGTGIIVLEGNWEEAEKAVVLKGKCQDPISGKPMVVKELLKWQDNNHHSMEMFREVDGKEFKDMEIKFTRK
ncbi:DUF1579 domain-containing protein [Chitinophaga nivalis]|uniref:DUF1579 domain-containing protein n=1 Tax=Chitinophaga nivalis TaxID=2991709 RepID=A0ABT3IGN4_9BACT|nr:DUF1579 domain-containing protein [Chitinophaga nivalis]MCW3467207.1 DUF1579 domain-containing protein [Chitinophaga nivalis]MCW3483101.1 DUF1579 domain-containing protein [Chitinophaga nivalis]